MKAAGTGRGLKTAGSDAAFAGRGTTVPFPPPQISFGAMRGHTMCAIPELCVYVSRM